MGKKNTSQHDQASEKFPPVVAVLGHVDHGKTTLLDAIRKSNIAVSEHGGITQRIGASSIIAMHDGQKRRITFIDTPGHETFSKMRSRGAQAADIGILVVAANDGVKPQTKESIAMLKKAGIPIVVAVTKADLPDKNVEKVKQQVMKEDILLEGLGGDVPYVEVSAKTGKNIQELLDVILLVSEIHDIKKGATPTGKLSAIVIESRLDMKVGPRVTVVIKNGTLTVRDEIVSEGISGRARTIINDLGKQQQSATIGDAVEILGFEKVPNVGSVITKKGEQEKQQDTPSVFVQTLPTAQQPMGLEVFAKQSLTEKSLNVILCADTYGSLEAIVNAMPEGITLISQKTGEITPADVVLAKSISAIVLGFNVRVASDVAHLARTEKVLVKNYRIVYELLDELKDVLEGKKLAEEEHILGKAKVLASFPFEKTQVLGVQILEGRVAKGDKIRLLRDKELIGESAIASVRQGKNQTSKVEAGKQAGIILSPFLDFTIGDMILSHD